MQGMRHYGPTASFLIFTQPAKAAYPCPWKFLLNLSCTRLNWAKQKLLSPNSSNQRDLMSLVELMFIWKTCFLMWIKVLVSSVYISFKKNSWILPVQDELHATVCRIDCTQAIVQEQKESYFLGPKWPQVLVLGQVLYWIQCIPPQPFLQKHNKNISTSVYPRIQIQTLFLFL